MTARLNPRLQGIEPLWGQAGIHAIMMRVLGTVLLSISVVARVGRRAGLLRHHPTR